MLNSEVIAGVLSMPKFSDFNDMSAKFDNLIKREDSRSDIRISISSKHHIFASITRIGLFKTGGIDVELVSISRSGALFSSAHHSFPKSLGKDLVIELSLNGKDFAHKACVVRKDTINNLYGIKFEQSVEAIDDYLSEFNISPHYGMDTPCACSVWLDLIPV